jgi:sugar lactone lactonase YvrE
MMTSNAHRRPSVAARVLVLLSLAGAASADPLADGENIVTVAGGGLQTGDGGLALDARLDTPSNVAFDATGNLFIADTNHHQIRRVDRTTGIITTVAGNGSPCPANAPAPGCGDGGPATSAMLHGPVRIAFDPRGNLFINGGSGGNTIRRVDRTTGIITTVVGNGLPCTPPASCGAGGLATDAKVSGALRGSVFDASGNLYFSEGPNTATPAIHAIMKVSAGSDGVIDGVRHGTTVNGVYQIDPRDDLIEAFAGNGTACAPSTDPCGDGGDARLARLNSPRSVALDASGQHMYIADVLDNRIRAIDLATRTISTVVGTGVPCAPTSDPCGEGGLAAQARLSLPTSVDLDSSGI